MSEDDNRHVENMRFPRVQRKSLLKRALSGTAWAFAAKLTGIASGLLVNAFIARVLSPEEFGAYVLLVSVVMFAALIARMGLAQAIVRVMAESIASGMLGRARSSLRLIYLIITIGSLIVGCGYYFGLGQWLAKKVFDVPIIAATTGASAIWIAALAFHTPITETFRGLHNIRLAVFIDGVLASFILAIMLGTVWALDAPVSLTEVVVLSLLSVSISLLIGLVLFLPRIRDLRGSGDIRMAEFLGISAPLFVTSIANYTMTNFSIWIAGALLSAGDVGLYGAAWKLVNLVVLPLMLVNTSVQPIISESLVIKNIAGLQRILQGTATLAAIPAFCVLALFMLFGDRVLALVYGAHYAQAAIVLAILSFGQLVNVWSGSCNLVLAFSGHQKQLMQLTLGTSLLAAVLTIAGGYYHGVLGVATGVALGRIAQNVAAWLLVYRLTGIWTHASLNPEFIRIGVRRIFRKRNAA